jgi:hypothetical protein
MILIFNLVFLTLASACCYRFFGTRGLLLQEPLLFVAGLFICRYYFRHWSKVWESHRNHNENIAIDLINGRFDFLNSFDMSEGSIKKNRRKMSNPAIMNLVLIFAPMGVSISMIFAKHRDYSTPLSIAWILSIPVSLGWLKMVMGVYFNFKKISYYEKKIGKPIINGLLK